MKTLSISFLLLVTWSLNCFSQFSIKTILCENKISALGVDPNHLHFGWEMKSPGRSQTQTAYQIVISSSKNKIDNGVYDVWNSAKISSDHNILVKYTGKALNSAEIYYWKVRVWDRGHNQSRWSTTAFFCTGISSEKEWRSAKWIGYQDMPDSMRIAPGIHAPFAHLLNKKGLERPVVSLLRKTCAINKRIESAFVFISGLGQYNLTINGKAASKGFLTPGWTYYDKTCLYNVINVTGLLRNGENCIGVILGNGFFNINRERYFKLVDAFGMPKLICRVKINYTDGSSQNIISDNSWKVSPSATTYSSIYGGEDFDARLEQSAWNTSGFDDRTWKDAEIVSSPKGNLVADLDYPVSIMDSFSVKRVLKTKSPVFVYDFGQNCSGIIKLKVKGKRGQVIKLYPSEILSKDSLANQGATGSPYYWSYTLKGEGIETWSPKFTYYGFRYVQIEGARPIAVPTDSLPAIVDLTLLHNRNSAPSNGNFACSDTLFNRIYTLINWAIKSNFQSLATDCPTREKLGWLEQDYLMGNSIHYNFDNYRLYHKMVFDLMDAQTSTGFVPDIAPEYVQFEDGFLDSPEWGSVCVIMPWLLYTWNNDIDIIDSAYPMMKKYVAYLQHRSDNQILSYGLGDWFDYGPKAPGVAQLTPVSLTATAIYFYDTMLLSKMAFIINKPDDGNNYLKQASEIKVAFNKKFFVDGSDVYSTGSQTAMAMPLSVGLVDKQYEKAVLKNLTDSIKFHHYELTAGDIGFHFLINALDKGGKSEIIYKMNNRDDVPGYGYQLKKGATALTESWPALQNVSNNHLMLGHIMEWFYSGLAGISQEESSVGFHKLRIRPQPIGNLTWAKGSFHTPYGLVSSSWQKADNLFTLTVSIPPNSFANIYLPVEKNRKVYEDGKMIKSDKGLETVVIPCGSGKYRFDVK